MDVLQLPGLAPCRHRTDSICGTLATLLRWTWSPDLMTFTASSGVVNLMGWFMVAICFVVSVEGVRRLRLSVPREFFPAFCYDL